MKKIAVLGSTGSIGTQTMEIAAHYDDIQPVTIAANKNIKLLEEQIRKFSPLAAAVYDTEAAMQLKKNVADTSTRILGGMEGVVEAATCYGAEVAVTSMVGSIGIIPTLEAIKAGCDIALANKETMVCAGDIVNAEAEKYGVRILPVDSEHSAIFQCLDGQEKFVRKILLTASGGPFFGKTKEQLADVTVKEALAHPNWSMGAKITVDSATLINKGLEFIEAVKLFGVTPDQIEVIIHRQSIVHSMVEFCDNSVIAQLGVPDMKMPIYYALTYPERRENISERLDLTKLCDLSFEKPDAETFYGLALGMEAAKVSGSMPTVYSSANEAAVDLFLQGKCKFLDIPKMVAEAMKNHKTVINPDIECILNTDSWAKNFVYEREMK